MTPTERRTTEEELTKLRKTLNDPWRLLRNAEKGLDPIIALAETRQLEHVIKELEDQLAEHK